MQGNFKKHNFNNVTLFPVCYDKKRNTDSSYSQKMPLNVCVGEKLDGLLPQFPLSVIFTFSVVDTDDLFTLLWSTQAEHCLLVVSLGVFQNSLLQRLSKVGLVFGTDLFQVHLAARHNNPGHHLLFG